jgi:hypothetical protein
VNKLKMQTSLGTIERDDQGVLILSIEANRISLKELDDNYLALKKLIDKELACGIIDAAFFERVSRVDLPAINKCFPRIYRVLAIVSPSLMSRTRAFFKTYKLRKKMPLWYFRSEKDARNWLQKFL